MSTETRRFSREELYQLIWSEPRKTLGPKFGISDVGLRKICASASIPMPPRGYWAKLRAGKKTKRIPLPPRGPGMSEEVTVGANRYSYGGRWTEEEILGPIPDPPTFDEPIELVRERVSREIGRVAMPTKLNNPHPAIARLLAEEEERRADLLAYPFSTWRNKLRFDDPVARRRLRLMNGLFWAVARADGRGSIQDEGTPEPVVHVHGRTIRLRLEPAKPTRRSGTAGRNPRIPLRLAILHGWNRDEERTSWSDADGTPLERCIAAIATDVVTTAEVQYREAQVRWHEWRIERKAELEERIRKDRAEAERRRREAEEAAARARVERLLGEAESLRRANDIRAYVQAVDLLAASDSEIDPVDLEEWKRWALRQAEGIDPVVSRAFLVDLDSQPPARGGEATEH